MRGGWIAPRVSFKCAKCGECCRFYWVPLTHRDVKRIAARTGLAPEEFAAELPKERVGEWGAPSFLLSDGAEHYLVLRKRDDGFCAFIKLEGTSFICSIYDARPTTCAFYPYVYVRRDDAVFFELAAGAPSFCPGLGKGPAHGLEAEFKAALLQEEELAEYGALVRRWNKLVVSGAVEATFRNFLKFISA